MTGLPDNARDAWKRHSKMCDAAADRAQNVATALELYQRTPSAGTQAAAESARRLYDQAEHGAALAAVAAERLTPEDDPAWAAWRACREAARVALAAAPSQAAEAAREALAAAEALSQLGPGRGWQIRARAKAIAAARGAAALASSRADWAEPDTDAPPDPRDALVASAQRALAAAEAALEAAREVVARVRAQQ